MKANIFFSNGVVSVDLRKNYNNVIIQLNDILGRQLMNKSYNKGRVFNLNINERPGGYFLTIVTENKKVVFRLVKN